VARYRLRFLLQEVDLAPGDTIIGRSATCQITIDDPLVSREHAKMCVEQDRLTIEDLKSRNGVLIGGKPLKGVKELVDGDRVRIGSQELVVCVSATGATTGNAQRRTTGFMCHCAACGTPYPNEAPGCPACGSKERAQEDTLTGPASDRDWALELAADAVMRALDKRSWDDVERLPLRASNNAWPTLDESTSGRCTASATPRSRSPARKATSPGCAGLYPCTRRSGNFPPRRRPRDCRRSRRINERPSPPRRGESSKA